MNESKKFDPSWITNGINTAAIDYAEELGKAFSDLRARPDSEKITTTQLRNIYGEVKVIEALGYEKAHTRFLLLRPKIAYTAKRSRDKSNRETALDEFRKVFEKAHSAVTGTSEEQLTRFGRFVDFMEAFLAYHRFHSERNN